MNTASLKKFAQQARKNLISGVIQRLNFWGYDNNGNLIEEPVFVSGGVILREEAYDESDAEPKWKALKKAIKEHEFKNVAEEAAYTWFNRLMAIRILARNDFDIPQLEFEDGVQTPVILRRARAGNYSFLEESEKSNLRKVLTDYDKEYQAFSILISGYCKHHKLLGSVFGRMNDYTELLLPSNILDTSGFIHMINTTDAVSDEDYRSPELIGWLYQFYISEKKDEVFAGFKKNKKAEAEDIPAATQIFTPNWIVKYMVQNTAGKIWLDEKPDSPLRSKMKYLVENIDEQEPEENKSLISEDPKNLKLLDPACGSGHILTEAFDLIYEMYLEDHYPPGEAVENILSHNLLGLDIDLRAAQLARFALLLKAANKDKSILAKGILPNIYSMPEKEMFDRAEVRQFLGPDGEKWESKLYNALYLMQDAKNLGSVMILDVPFEMQKFLISNFIDSSEQDIYAKAIFNKLRPFLEIIFVLAEKYEAVVTNPPYMRASNMNSNLKNYVAKNYPKSKSDLFAVFMEVCLNLAKKEGLTGMINQQSWMFLSSYEKLREEILNNNRIDSMLHLGPRTFDEISGEVVQSTSFIIQALTTANFQLSTANYYRLIDYKSSEKKEKAFLERKNFYPSVPQSNFSKIPGYPIAFWANNKVLEIFKNKKINELFELQGGVTTGNDDLHLRNWYEVDFKKIGLNNKSEDDLYNENKKWFPLNKVVGSIKWDSYYQFVINFKERGKMIVEAAKAYNYRLKDPKYYFRPGISWSDVGSNKPSFRYQKEGILFAARAPMIFAEDYTLLAFLNSCVARYILEITSPTLTFNLNEIRGIPIISLDKEKSNQIKSLVNEAYNISNDYSKSREISFDFLKLPLLRNKKDLRSDYNELKNHINTRFIRLNQIEEHLNRLFIEEYDLDGELTSNILLRDITIYNDEINQERLSEIDKLISTKKIERIELLINKQEIIKQLLSYSLGCFMGRYRLDKQGLCIAYSDYKAEEIESYPVESPYQFSYALRSEREDVFKNYEDFKTEKLFLKREKQNLSNISNIDNKIVLFEIDDDGIIPIMSRDCAFPDNGVDRVKQFIEIVWGEETLTENMNFLEECLGTTLENFMVKDFWKDHCRRYKKRPIYWLFSSKNGAFQVLAYMHRMNRHTAEKVRSKYLLPHIKYLESQVTMLRQSESSLSRLEARRLDKFRKDLEECREYDLQLKDVADKQIEFDLDDGVKVNYAKFGGVLREVK